MKGVTSPRGGRAARTAGNDGAEPSPTTGSRPAARRKTADRKGAAAGTADPTAKRNESPIPTRGREYREERAGEGAAPVASPGGVAPGGEIRPMAAAAAPGTPLPRPAPRPASHEEIARRAFEIYVARGGGHGHAEEDWLLAEAQLRLVAPGRNERR